MTYRFLFFVAMMVSSIFSEAFTISEAQRRQWLEVADSLKPELHKSVHKPVGTVELTEDPTAFQGVRFISSVSPDSIYRRRISDGESVIFDFGEHLVGSVTIELSNPWMMQDARQRFFVSFAEVPSDLHMPREPFTGSLSRAWLQDFQVDVDYNEKHTIPWRVTGRYMKITPVSPSPYCVSFIKSVEWEATTSAGRSHCRLESNTPEIFRQIAKVSENTLRDCMQTVYEDGPKRDQRLWGGDFYLQALANTVTFQQHSLTKRCLYLLAACADPLTGQINSNLADTPRLQWQSNQFQDYALAFMPTLDDYFDATGDTATVIDLWDIARHQLDATIDGVRWNTVFFDWCPVELNKDAALHCYTMYIIKRAMALASKIGRNNDTSRYAAILKSMRRRGRKSFWDEARGAIVSGSSRQISRTGISWAVLGGLLSEKESKRALRYALYEADVIKCGTPYANHFFVQALIDAGLAKEARNYVEEFWGGMVKHGADTFWEFYIPEDHFFSSYNGYTLLNSYCHAWSCTPVYFIVRYPEIFQNV